MVRGKFFFDGDEKIFLKGVCYGPFAPSDNGGSPFPARSTVRRDFHLIRELGANCLRTFTSPPPSLLDDAADAGLAVIVGLPWAQHVCFLDDPAVVASVRAAVRAGVAVCRGHPAVLAYLLGNEIPPDIVRWQRPERVERFLEGMFQLVKELDDRPLVSYANFPPTEYLRLEFLDFVSFNVYLHQESALRRYLSRLQVHAHDKPLVLTETGIDSIRQGLDGQASMLGGQIRAALGSGLAGTILFAWTDEWFTGGCSVEDWAFGLVDRERRPKPAYHAVRDAFGAALPPLNEAPRVSVVICAFNAERTLEACLRSVEALRYPSYEIVLVNDGSQDATLDIARRHPRVRIVSQPNLGLSAARNAGVRAASGEIVAFTDADCTVDPDWLTYLVETLTRPGFVAAGGPNLTPYDEPRVAACVDAAPGKPAHVLLDDELAEHVPGCNMGFHGSSLIELGGFDPAFRAAGDDVDVCWRLQDRGHRIGFSPAAVVWHSRRATLRGYLEQQIGYGKAEAQLRLKHPHRFNALGQSKWAGRIYGGLEAPLFSRRPVIYHGKFGSALFQTLYHQPSSGLGWVLSTVEWTAFAVVALLAALLTGWFPVWAGAIPLLMSAAVALRSAWSAKLGDPHDRWSNRAIVGALSYLGPLVRSTARQDWRLGRGVGGGRVHARPLPFESLHGRLSWRYWCESGTDQYELLEEIESLLSRRGCAVSSGDGWSSWDLSLRRGGWAKAALQLAVENHGGQKRLFRIRTALGLTRSGALLLGLCFATALLGALNGIVELAWGALLLGGAGLYRAVRQGRLLAETVQEAVGRAAQGRGLVPWPGSAAKLDPKLAARAVSE